MQGCHFWGLHSHCAPFWRSNAPKMNILVTWISIFKPNVQNIQTLNYNSDSKNLQNDKDHQSSLHGLSKNAPHKSKMAALKITISKQQFDRFWQSTHHITCFCISMCLLWLTLMLHSILWVKCPQNPILGYKFAFSNQTYKISHFCTIKTTATSWIKVLFGTVIDHQVLFVGCPKMWPRNPGRWTASGSNVSVLQTITYHLMY